MNGYVLHAPLWPTWLTLVLALAYFLKQWLRPAAATRQHDALRQDWLIAVSASKGTEVLAVQTIRNSLMSCTMTATTATLALMGGVTLLHSGWAQAEAAGRADALQWQVLAVLVVLGLSFITSMLAARQWHHAGFVAGMPTESPQRQQWLVMGQNSIRRAGRYYAFSVRLLMWCVPLLLVGLQPWLGLAAALVLLWVLSMGIDR
jgi:hypothetical protein